MICGIYSITHTLSGKQYIGSSDNIRRRWNRHKNELSKDIHPNAKLQAAWNKYGHDNFSFRVIEEVDNVGILLDREQYWIDKISAVVSGYNLSPTAQNTKGVFPSAEAREKMAKAKRGKPRTAETRAKISAYQQTRTMSPETCVKISEAKKGYKFSEEAKAKMSAAKIGKKQAPELVLKRIAAASAAKALKKKALNG